MKKIAKLLLISMLALFSIGAMTGCNSQTVNGIEYSEANGELIVEAYNDYTSVTTITVPDEIGGKPVVKIANFGLVDTLYVETIIIGKNVREIEPIGIKNNAALTKFVVAEGNTHFKVVDDCLYTADGSEFVAYPTKLNLQSRKVNGKTEFYTPLATVVDGTKTIRPYSFYHAGYIEKVALPNSVEYIGEAAFLRCGMLKEMLLSTGLKTISKDAFSQNKGLTTLTIHSAIEEISSQSFYNCTNLLTINICKAESEIKLGAKWYPSNLGKKVKTVFNWNYVCEEEK